MPFIHFDEAKQGAISTITLWLSSARPDDRVLLIVDLFGKLRLALWVDAALDFAGLDQDLSTRCGAWWTGEALRVAQADQVTQRTYENAWKEGRPDPDTAQLRVLDRHRSRTAWFTDAVAPLWEAPIEGPPIVVFYSFKGGLGRSTLLASFAIQQAQAGERVCVVDFDLDSPGVGSLLSADAQGLTARWGVVDFLLEQGLEDPPLGDYYHRCDRVAGAGEIAIFPTGKLDEEYADKLARVDLEESPSARQRGLWRLIDRIGSELKPKWILLDARTGISEPAGLLLSGIAHLHVLLGATQSQSWQGLNRVLDRLGKERVLLGQPQADVMLVHAMVPVGEAGSLAKRRFAAQAESEFTQRYYAETKADGGDGDRYWDISDMESRDAPHVAVPIDYDARLADFADIAEVAETLCAGSFATLAERIKGRFTSEADT